MRGLHGAGHRLPGMGGQGMKLGDKVMRLPETFTDSGHVRESFKGVSD